jgi:hypothetical protein
VLTGPNSLLTQLSYGILRDFLWVWTSVRLGLGLVCWVFFVIEGVKGVVPGARVGHFSSVEKFFFSLSQ